MKVIYGNTGDFIFREAAAFLKQKEPLAKEEYEKLSTEARAKAFTVAGYSRVEVVEQFLKELAEAVEAGSTKEDFMATMQDFLERNGFSPTNPFHLDVIFRTNIQTAYNAGHYKAMTEPTVLKLRPYWQYITAGDGEVRESHAAMEGRVYHATDPIWNIWYPPNGFRCRCSIKSLSKRQLEQRGLEVSKEIPYELDRETGELKASFPDKGFSNNPAKTVWKPDMEQISAPLTEAFMEIQAENEKRNRQKAKPQEAI